MGAGGGVGESGLKSRLSSPREVSIWIWIGGGGVTMAQIQSLSSPDVSIWGGGFYYHFKALRHG